MSAYTYETSVDSDEVYNIDNRILDQFNEFNAEYANYVRCNYNNTHANDPNHPPLLDPNGDQLYCSANQLNGNNVLKKYNALNASLLQLNSKISDMPTNSDQNPVPDINTLQTTQNQIIQLRTQIDHDLNELNEHENSIAFSKRKVLDSSVYATLLWTTAATILVLVVFTRL